MTNKMHGETSVSVIQILGKFIRRGRVAGQKEPECDFRLAKRARVVGEVQVDPQPGFLQQCGYERILKHKAKRTATIICNIVQPFT